MEKPPIYLEINLNNRKPRPMGFLRSLSRTYSEVELLWLIKKAAADKKLSGMVLNTSGLSCDRSFFWELRTALEKFKATGKKIIAYFEEADLDLYCMVSVADKIVIDKSGTVAFFGYSMGRLYVKETLEKIGAGFREMRYLDYKTANEMFSRTDMSEADREQYGAYLDEIFSSTKNTIQKARGFDDEKFNSLLNNCFLFSSKDALDKGLADAAGREEAVNAAICEMEKIEKTEKNEKDEIAVFKVWGSSSIMTNGRHVPYYKAPRPGGRKAEIALVLAKGNTAMDEGMSARSLSKVIFEAAEKSSVKAVVLRIDSPGGSAVAADYIAAAVEKIKKDKPVVVTLGPVAASGGYWAAMNASHITASPYTLTGSIGVIAGWFYNKTLNDKLGVNVDSVFRGDHADLLSGFLIPSRDLSPQEESQFRTFILDLYSEFVRKAAAGRGMKEEELEPLARGRIYSGSAALNLKLIDSLGGYLEAIQTACDLAKIPANRKIIIREYPKPKFIETLAAKYLTASLIVPGQTEAGRTVAELFRMSDDLSYRLSQNGKAMPILPLGFCL